MAIRLGLIGCGLLALGVMAWGSAAVGAPSASTPSTVLVLGRISDDPKKHSAQLQPLLDYVVPRMRDVGIREGRILMARDVQQMGSYLRRGRVDWVTETAGMAVALGQRSGARPLLLTERNGVREYHSLFFVRADSPVRDLQDLRGRTLALQSTYSTSAYLVPLMALLDGGLQPEILQVPGDVPADDAVGYMYARSEFNIAAWVHKGVVDAGAFSSVDWDDPKRLPSAFKSDLRVVWRSEPFPRAVEITRRDLDPRVRARLREVLLQAAADPAAAEALKAFFGTSAFHPLDARAQQRLDALGRGQARVRTEVE